MGSTLCSLPAHFERNIPLLCVFESVFTFKYKLLQKQGCSHTWDLKYVSCGVDSTSADAISRWRRIWRKEGLFLGLQFLQIHKRCSYDQNNYKLVKHLPSACASVPVCIFSTSGFLVHVFQGHYQHCLRRILKPSGQLSGIGSWRLLFPTPQMMAEESTSL